MARKIERWLSEVFPGAENIVSAYDNLTPRELVVVAIAVLDAALLELLEQRLIDDPKEAESFLGANGDGRAPAGSFGARIQMAYLSGLITEHDMRMLRCLKSLRNLFAHRVNVDFVSPIIVKELKKLHREWTELQNRLVAGGLKDVSVNGLRDIERNLGIISEAGEGLVLAIFAVYQAYFHRLANDIPRIGPVKRS